MPESVVINCRQHAGSSFSQYFQRIFNILGSCASDISIFPKEMHYCWGVRSVCGSEMSIFPKEFHYCRCVSKSSPAEGILTFRPSSPKYLKNRWISTTNSPTDPWRGLQKAGILNISKANQLIMKPCFYYFRTWPTLKKGPSRDEIASFDFIYETSGKSTTVTFKRHPKGITFQYYQGKSSFFERPIFDIFSSSRADLKGPNCDVAQNL